MSYTVQYNISLEYLIVSVSEPRRQCNSKVCDYLDSCSDCEVSSPVRCAQGFAGQPLDFMLYLNKYSYTAYFVLVSHCIILYSLSRLVFIRSLHFCNSGYFQNFNSARLAD